MPVHYIYLVVAIVAETIGTTALQASQQFTRFWPTCLVVVAYGLAFYMLGLALKFMPVGIAYAIWSGLGIVLISVAGAILYKQIPDTPALLGMALIVIGVTIIHFSETTV